MPILSYRGYDVEFKTDPTQDDIDELTTKIDQMIGPAKRQKTTLTEDFGAGLRDIYEIPKTGIALGLAGASRLAGADDFAESVLTNLDEDRKAIQKREAGLDRGEWGKVAKAVGQIPAYLNPISAGAMIAGSGAETGMGHIDAGVDTENAIAGMGMDMALGTAGMAIPAALVAGRLKNAVATAGANTAQNAVSHRFQQGIREDQNVASLPDMTWGDYAASAIPGFAFGAVAAKKGETPSNKENKTDEQLRKEAEDAFLAEAEAALPKTTPYNKDLISAEEIAAFRAEQQRRQLDRENQDVINRTMREEDSPEAVVEAEKKRTQEAPVLLGPDGKPIQQQQQGTPLPVKSDLESAIEKISSGREFDLTANEKIAWSRAPVPVLQQVNHIRSTRDLDVITRDVVNPYDIPNAKSQSVEIAQAVGAPRNPITGRFWGKNKVDDSADPSGQSQGMPSRRETLEGLGVSSHKLDFIRSRIDQLAGKVSSDADRIARRTALLDRIEQVYKSGDQDAILKLDQFLNKNGYREPISTKKTQESGLVVSESSASDWPTRTKRNVDAADVTIAMAHDYSTGGERLTKRLAESRGYSRFIEFAGSIDNFAKNIVAGLTNTRGTSINVAGNGIYTWKLGGKTQEQVNQMMFDTLSRVKEMYPNLRTIITGGQTGSDIAGAIAGRALGLNVDVHMPKGFLQKNADGKTVSNTKEGITKYIEEAAKALRQDSSNPRVEIIDDATKTKYIAGTRKDGTIYVNTAQVRQLFSGDKTQYLRDSPQKMKMLEAVGETPEKFMSRFETPEQFIKFLIAHERAHIESGDLSNYPRTPDGKLDLMHPKAIEIEIAATKAGLKALKEETQPSKPQRTLHEEAVAATRAYSDAPTLGRTTPNLRLSNTIANTKYVGSFLQKMVRVLRMQDRQIIVMTLRDAYKQSQALGDALAAADGDKFSPMFHVASTSKKVSYIVVREGQYSLGDLVSGSSRKTIKDMEVIQEARAEARNRGVPETEIQTEQRSFANEQRDRLTESRENKKAEDNLPKRRNDFRKQEDESGSDIDSSILRGRIEEEGWSRDKAEDYASKSLDPTRWTEERVTQLLDEIYGPRDDSMSGITQSVLGGNKESRSSFLGRYGDVAKAEKVRLIMGLSHEMGHAFMEHALLNADKVAGSKPGKTAFDDLVVDFVKWVGKQNDDRAFLQKTLAQPDLLGMIGQTHFSTKTDLSGTTKTQVAETNPAIGKLANYFGKGADATLTKEQRALLTKKATELLADNAAFREKFGEFFAEQIARGTTMNGFKAKQGLVAETVSQLKEFFRNVAAYLQREFNIPINEKEVMTPFMNKFMDKWYDQYVPEMAEKVRLASIAKADGVDRPDTTGSQGMAALDTMLRDVSNGLPSLSVIRQDVGQIAADLQKNGIKDIRPFTANGIRLFTGHGQYSKIVAEHPIVKQIGILIRDADQKAAHWFNNQIGGTPSDSTYRNNFWKSVAQADVLQDRDSFKALSRRASIKEILNVANLMRENYGNLEHKAHYQKLVSQGKLKSDVEKMLYMRIADISEAQYKRMADALATVGSKMEINRVPGWYAAVRQGEHVIYAEDASGKPTYEAFQTKGEAMRGAKKYEKLGYRVSYQHEPSRYRGELSREMEQAILDQISNLPEKDAVRTMLEDMVYQKASAGFGGGKNDLSKHFKYRENYEGSKGFSRIRSDRENALNFLEAVQESAHSYNRFARNLELLHSSEPIVGRSSELNSTHENATLAAQMFRDHAIGRRPFGESAELVNKVLDKISEGSRWLINKPFDAVGNVIGRDIRPLRTDVNAFHQINNRFSQMFYIWALTTRPQFWASQVASPLLGLRALTHAKVRFGDENVNIFKGLLEGTHALVSNPKDFMDFFVWAKQNTETFNPQLVAEMNRIEMFRNNQSMEKVWEWISGQIPAQASDSFSRVMTASMFYHAMKDSKQFKSKEDLFRRVAMETDNAMISYRRADRPELYGRAGQLGELAGPLTTFYHGTVGNFIADAKMAAEIRSIGDVNKLYPLLVSQATFMTLGGVIGVVGYAEAELFIKFANYLLGLAGVEQRIPSLYETLIKMDDEWLGGQTAKDMLIHGVPSGATGLDIGASMRAAPIVSQIAVGDRKWFEMFPQVSFMMKQVPAFGTKIQAEVYKQTGFGKPVTSAEEDEATKQVVPGGYRGLARELGAFSDQGVSVTQGTKRSMGGVERNIEEKIAEYIGGRSLAQAKSQRSMSQAKGKEQSYVEARQRGVDLVTDGVMEGRDDKIQSGIDLLVKSGLNGKQINDAIYNAMINRMTPEQMRWITNKGKFTGSATQKRHFEQLYPYMEDME
jgi:hypothetical protein